MGKTTIFLDGDDNTWAFADQDDGTWKVYQRAGEGDVWIETDHLPTWEDAIAARARRAERRKLGKEINQLLRCGLLDQAGMLMETHNFTVEEINEYSDQQQQQPPAVSREARAKRCPDGRYVVQYQDGRVEVLSEDEFNAQFIHV